MADSCGDDELESLPVALRLISKKRHRTTKWDKVTLEIEGTSVLYYDSNHVDTKVRKKSIEMSGAKVADVDEFPEYPYAFSVCPKGSSRTYYFSTPDEESKLVVLNKICELQLAEKTQDGQSSACIIQ